jgi:hypothetical protein
MSESSSGTLTAVGITSTSRSRRCTTAAPTGPVRRGRDSAATAARAAVSAAVAAVVGEVVDTMAASLRSCGNDVQDRVRAVADFGLPDRQARFLVTVMLHAGVCVPRQFARFAGTAYGHTVNEFFDKIVRRYASVWPCHHHRARLYHVHQLRLYRAIGQPASRYRRPVSVRQVIERLMWIDEIIDNKDVTWLATTDEKVDFFHRTLPTLARERLPHTTLTRGASPSTRVFPDHLPIGGQPDGRVVFPYLITTSFFKDAFCAFLQRHIHVLHALPAWTVRILLPPGFGSMSSRSRPGPVTRSWAASICTPGSSRGPINVTVSSASVDMPYGPRLLRIGCGLIVTAPSGSRFAISGPMARPT